MLTVAACVATMIPAGEVQAEEIRSVYTNEVITQAQAVTRPIAVMMPTDKVAQPSYGISHAKVLYEIMEDPVTDLTEILALIPD